MKHLRESNPWQKWVENRISVKLELLSGRTIIVRFTAKDDHLTPYRFDGREILNDFAGDFLVAPSASTYLEQLEVASAVADTLNDRIEVAANAMYHVAAISFNLLDVIGSGDKMAANLILVELCNHLVALNQPKTDEIWGEWLEDVEKTLDAL